MAEATNQDKIQPLPATKRMLGMAEKDPLSCAFALTKDKKECVLLIEKLGKPKKVADTLKTDGKAFLDLQTMRFGTVKIDVPGDPGTVKFTVNRSEAGGTITHMVKLVKKAGYQGLVINADESLENEPEGTQPAPGAPPPTAPQPPPAAAPIDAAALKARLTALVQRMMTVIAADPARKDALLALAKQAQLMLGTNNLKTATERTDELEAALDQAGKPGSVPPAPPTPNGPAKPTGAVAYAKSRMAWTATSQRVTADIAKLRTALQDQYKGDDNGPAIVSAYDARVAPVLKVFDADLADKLDEATNAADAAARQKLVDEARQLIDKYKAFLDGETLIADLDDNPFVKLSIRATVGATLTALSAAVH